ncbi:MAG: carboxypeptidase regulatory-like domain-containing protein, partial [Thermoplasmata archaeon]|nr:carboxypeptidase regulatory-like domain-containing protein [Thermoplasmata archaeon]
PVAMAYQGGNWYSGTTNRMSSYNGMSVGVKAGYNITVLYDNNSTVTAPSLPNPFTNLSVAQSVSGEWMFEMTVSPTLYGLSGVVADAISSIGLAGVHLTLTPGNGTVAVTDATGAYAFVDLVNGSYTLTVSAAGYQSTNETVTIADANAVENVPLYTLSSSGPPHTSGGGSSGLPSLLLGAGLWVVVAIVVGTLALGAWMAWRRRKGSAAGSRGSSPDAPTSAAEADRTVGATSRRHVGWVVAILLVALVVGAGAAYAEHWNPLPKSGGANATMAPAFTLPSIYGENFTLAHYRNSSVVVVEFTSLSCSECQIVEKSLASLYSNYNGTGTTRVQFVSRPITQRTTSPGPWPATPVPSPYRTSTVCRTSRRCSSSTRRANWSTTSPGLRTSTRSSRRSTPPSRARRRRSRSLR